MAHKAILVFCGENEKKDELCSRTVVLKSSGSWREEISKDSDSGFCGGIVCDSGGID